MIKRYPVFTPVSQPRPIENGEKQSKNCRKYESYVMGSHLLAGPESIPYSPFLVFVAMKIVMGTLAIFWTEWRNSSFFIT